MIQILSYDPNWPGQFLSLRSMLQGCLGSMAQRIEHVGSTSIPGLDAKAVIDIDVVVQQKDKPAAVLALKTLGYEPLGDLGIPQREAFAGAPGPIKHNLYLCPPESQALANHLAIRDYLRKHPEQVQVYGALKRRLAREHGDDVEAYVEGKSDFLLQILADCGFDESELAAIRIMNKNGGQGP
jgi:GrpB-like predicted nucleotidyltransferase (UPF0157 family)